MRVLLQRVKDACVIVENRGIVEIRCGLLLLVGIGKDDKEDDLARLSQKILSLRVFDDPEGKMNLNVRQIGGEILSIPQFTLYADIQRGNRPGFESAAPPEKAQRLWIEFNALLKKSGATVKEGVFGASMEVGLTNDGPVTIWLDSKL